MPLAISEDHVALQQVVRDFVAREATLETTRAWLETGPEAIPRWWPGLAHVGWLGLHLAEGVGGSGHGAAELAIVTAELARAVTPGPFLSTVACSAVLAKVGEGSHASAVRGLSDGSLIGAIGLTSDVTVTDGRASGVADAVLGVPGAHVILICSDDSMIVVAGDQPGVSIERPQDIDRSRRVGRVRLEDVAVGPDDVLAGARTTAAAVLWTLGAAEAAGIAHACLDRAVAYAKLREQFGGPIGRFQAVKHHCANMLVAAELAAATASDAAHAADAAAADEWLLAAAVAAKTALQAAMHNAQLNIQIHGGIGFSWEHDAHLFLRRAVALQALLAGADPNGVILGARRRGLVRHHRLDLGPDEQAIRAEVSDVVARIEGADPSRRHDVLVDEGYLQPHWPAPWGRAATPATQLIIDDELAAAGIERRDLGITGWVIATIIQHGTAAQTARWVDDALRGTVWCQLFSEPDAGSDAAAVRTRGIRHDGGWLVSGQKVWTSGAHVADWGLATVRTDPASAKHRGITMMAIDMHAGGVEVRPLRQITGTADFNEVYFDKVFVPDRDVVGEVGEGWTVARSTLGNERVTLGGGDRYTSTDLVHLYDCAGAPERLEPELTRLLAMTQAARLLELRRAQRAVAGTGPGPEGNVTKLLQAELLQDFATFCLALAGSHAMFEDGPGATAAFLSLNARRAAIAGGTSEITRNQIAERILGLPRSG